MHGCLGSGGSVVIGVSLSDPTTRPVGSSGSPLFCFDSSLSLVLMSGLGLGDEGEILSDGAGEARSGKGRGWLHEVVLRCFVVSHFLAFSPTSLALRSSAMKSRMQFVDWGLWHWSAGDCAPSRGTRSSRHDSTQMTGEVRCSIADGWGLSRGRRAGSHGLIRRIDKIDQIKKILPRLHTVYMSREPCHCPRRYSYRRIAAAPVSLSRLPIG
jgi:hypothetical protein